MENEIKVGEYVRDNKGLIFYIMGVDYDDYITDIIYNPEIHKRYKGRYDFGVKDYLLYFTKEQIRKMKHSSDLIDLIQCGDYVNGHKILEIKRNVESGLRYLMYDHVPIKYYVERTDEIKTIVTKEMMESISYKVERKD